MGMAEDDSVQRGGIEGEVGVALARLIAVAAHPTAIEK
jgi:hypothetical protein